MDKLETWIQSIVKENNCQLYEIEWLTNQNPPLLRVSIEKPNGSIDLDTCALVSEAIGTCLDEKDWYSKEYMLEVCSPGAEKELKTTEQMQQSIGKYVFVKLKDPKKGIDQVFGDLKNVDEHRVVIDYKEKTRTKTIEIERNNIDVIMTAVKV